MTIYVPEIGGVTLSEIIRLIRMRLGDFPQKRRQVETGDGVTVNYRLTNSPYETDGVTSTVAGTTSTAFTVDYDASWLTFTSAAADAAEIVLNYSTVVWSNERITEAVNSAIDELFGRFYVKGVNAALVSDGTAEMLVETAALDDLGPEDRITRVEYWDGSRWRRFDRWSVRATATAKYVVFDGAPSSGQAFRVSYVVRPGNLSAGAQTLEGTAGLPSRAKEPLVLLACSSLIVERMHHRIRDDRGHNTQGDNPVKSYEIQNDAQFLRQQAEVLASKLKMDPLTSRLRQ